MAPIPPYGLVDKDPRFHMDTATLEGLVKYGGDYAESLIPPLLPTDARIAHPIDLTGGSYSDEGFAELLALAAPLARTIELPADAEIKLEPNRHLVPPGVGFRAPGSGDCAALRIPTEWGATAYALTSGNIAKGATTLPLKFVTAGAFKAATPESPQRAYICRIGMITYTGIEGTGESITLTGVTGITAAVGSLAFSVVQGCGLYVENGGVGRWTVFGDGIAIKGPNKGSNAAWSTSVLPESMDGVYLGNNARIDCEVSGFRRAVTMTGDHQIIGTNFKPTNCYSGVCFAGPRMTAGDQLFEAGCLLTSPWWASIEVADGNYMNNIKADKVHLGAPACWGIWKEATRGLAASEQSSGYITTSGNLLIDPSFEGVRLGGIGCPDGKALLQGLEMINPTLAYAAPPAGQTRVSAIACKVRDITIRGKGFLNTTFAGQEALILADEFTGQIDGFESSLNAAASLSIPVVKGVLGEEVLADIRFKQGRYFGRGADAGIKRGDVCSYYGPQGANSVRRYGGLLGMAGVALTDSFHKALALATNAIELVTVRVKEQSNPPTSPAAVANATAGSLEGRKYFYKVAAVLSGGGLMAASAEVSATAEASKSIKVTWVAPTVIPGGQTITGYRVYRGIVAGEEKGYKAVGAVLEYLDSGAALTGTTTAPTKNTGCEIYGTGLVRTYGATAPGCACIASGPTDSNGIVFAQTYNAPDNGETAQILITPALL